MCFNIIWKELSRSYVGFFPSGEIVAKSNAWFEILFYMKIWIFLVNMNRRSFCFSGRNGQFDFGTGECQNSSIFLWSWVRLCGPKRTVRYPWDEESEGSVFGRTDQWYDGIRGGGSARACRFVINIVSRLYFGITWRIKRFLSLWP